jgi:uncharacterized protein (TIGR02145 family)
MIREEYLMKNLVICFTVFLLFFIGCDKKSTEPEPKESSTTVTDIDGNVYQIVKIGDQVWMAENLKVTHYRNGDAIPNITDNSEWENLSNGAYCSYDNADSNTVIYGLLYNWFAVLDSNNIAPIGWHVPSDEEWKELEIFLGMNQYAADSQGTRGTYEGSKLKDSGTNHWTNPNTGANNESGFSALPGGYRSNTDGRYGGEGTDGTFWSASEGSTISAWSRKLLYNSTKIVRNPYYVQSGMSVRCVKN